MMRRCDRVQCPEQAFWRVSLRLWTANQGEYRQPPVNLAVCETHREEMTPDAVLNDETWEHVVAAWERQGWAAPDRRLTDLVFHPLILPGVTHVS